MRISFDTASYKGPPIDDFEILELVPDSYRSVLQQANGFILFSGSLHLRGACREPNWHSLRRAWRGPDAFHLHYDLISEQDLPFAEDCVGDQFFLRDNSVFRLMTETGDVEELDMSLAGFLEAVQEDPDQVLGLQPLRQFQAGGGLLQPGQLLNVFPPYCTKEAAAGVTIAAVPAEDRIRFLAGLARMI